jgi:hypothetical protein
MAYTSTNFDPTIHGFQFVNSFDLLDLFVTNLSLPAIGSLGDIVYGLCGGMCCAALDYYEEGMPVPIITDVDDIPNNLLNHLKKRQLDTLSVSVLKKIVNWSISNTKDLGKKVAQEQIPAIMSSIDSGKPCILVLIRAWGIFEIIKNHQVLAIAYNHDTNTNDMAIRLYDPNHPRQSPELTMNLSNTHIGINLAQSTGEILRGFFKINYKHASPPK